MKKFICKFCKEELSLEPKQIGGHVKNCKCNPNKKKNDRTFSDAGIEFMKRISDEKRMIYNSTPKKCKKCGKIIPYEKRTNNFCDSICSGSYNTLLRGGHSHETKEKIKNSLTPDSIKIQVKSCITCGKLFVIRFNSKKTHCSKSCIKHTEETKLKLSLQKKKLYEEHPEKHPNIRCSNKMSYPEKFFMNYIESNGLKRDIDFICQYKIKNYFVDFYFPKLNLCVEIDGEYWHKKNDPREISREIEIKRYSNLVRFWSKELIKKEYENEILKIINACIA